MLTTWTELAQRHNHQKRFLIGKVGQILLNNSLKLKILKLIKQKKGGLYH